MLYELLELDADGKVDPKGYLECWSMTQGREVGLSKVFRALKKFAIYYYYYANYIQNILFTTMRPPYCIESTYKWWQKGYILTVSKSERQHGRKRHISLTPQNLNLSCCCAISCTLMVISMT